MRILLAPVLEECVSANFLVSKEQDNLRFFQNILDFGIIDVLDMLVIREILFFTVMPHDLEASGIECKLIL